MELELHLHLEQAIPGLSLRALADRLDPRPVQGQGTEDRRDQRAAPPPAVQRSGWVI